MTEHDHTLLEEVRAFCIEQYMREYEDAERQINVKDVEEKERVAQKQAIQTTFFKAIRRFANTDAGAVWSVIYNAHVHRKSGISDDDTIRNVLSASQSWKKSSGHAFEEFIQQHATEALRDDGIKIILQRDLSRMLKEQQVHNAAKDIEWLTVQLKAAVFDLYAVVTCEDGRNLVFGCIQSKTSIRDRVTRDREPSLAAMGHFFWSICITLDGDFLKMPKFKAMVNGGASEFAQNGWHGLYVLSPCEANDRIYPIDATFSLFRLHAKQAAAFWLTQRQWFNAEWKAD